MDHMKKYELERTFEQNTQFHARRSAKIHRDFIYRGIFENDLIKTYGYTQKELAYAEEQGWVERTYVVPDGTVRCVILWLGEEMPQRSFFKQQIDKIVRFFEGTYQRYYGKSGK